MLKIEFTPYNHDKGEQLRVFVETTTGAEIVLLDAHAADVDFSRWQQVRSKALQIKQLWEELCSMRRPGG